MRNFFTISTLLSFSFVSSASNSFGTNAKFSVNDKNLSLSSAIATIEALPKAPGYFLIRINFYSFPPSAEDMADIENGSVDSMNKKWTKLANNVNSYNTSNAIISLTVDKNLKVWQVDMSIPGHSCTVAPYEPDVKNFMQHYKFDRKTIILKSKGSYLCDLSPLKITNQKYEWDINLETRVFEKK